MNKTLRLVLVSGTALAGVAIANLASAQPAPPPPLGPAGAVTQPIPPRPPGPVSDLQQLPETRGTVQRFTLAPRGELDGFLLADGTQVHLPPHLSAQLAAAVRPGDPVSVRGYRSAAAPLIVAVAVTDTATNQSIVDRGPPAPGVAPPPPPPGIPTPGAQQTTLTGKVQTPLYGPAGDLNGAALEDGVIVRLPPPEAYQYTSLLTPGKMVTVQGWALTTAYGRVVDAQEINPASTAAPTPDR
jgi:hypothetical protein